MEYNVHAWVENTIIKCASQNCSECIKFKEGKCQPAKLIVTPKK